MTDLETVNDLPIQNLTIQEDKKEEELPEVTNTLIQLPEESAATEVNRRTSPRKKTMEMMLQKEEEEYAIYIGMLSEEQESDTCKGMLI